MKQKMGKYLFSKKKRKSMGKNEDDSDDDLDCKNDSAHSFSM